MAWSLIPDHVWHGIGITYYPDRWWAVALPAYTLMFLLFFPLLYAAWSMFNTLDLDHLNTMMDAWGTSRRERQRTTMRKKCEKKLHRLNQMKQQPDVANSSDSMSGEEEDVEEDGYSIPEMYDLTLTEINRIYHHQAARDALEAYVREQETARLQR